MNKALEYFDDMVSCNQLDYNDEKPKCDLIRNQLKAIKIFEERPFESATTINYIQINKDNPKMLDYEHYTMSVKYILPKEDFETLVRCIKNEQIYKNQRRKNCRNKR